MPRQRRSLVLFNRSPGITSRSSNRPGARGTRGNNELGASRSRRRASARRAAACRLRQATTAFGALCGPADNTADGRVGFAPFVVRPPTGGARVAVVLPTLTWQAYNLRDDDGDGRGDTWYASWKVRTARLAPYLNRGVPNHFRRYDLPVPSLARERTATSTCSPTPTSSRAGCRHLEQAYDLIVFPGHHEYVTKREYDLVEGYRNLGGNLAFLSANNFFWGVVKRGRSIEKTKQWRDLGRPEAALIGVQYRGNDNGRNRGPWIVRDSAPRCSRGWASGTDPASAAVGSRSTTPPPTPPWHEGAGRDPEPLRPRLHRPDDVLRDAGGAKVFAAGAFTLAGSISSPDVGLLVANVWARLTAQDERVQDPSVPDAGYLSGA